MATAGYERDDSGGENNENHEEAACGDAGGDNDGDGYSDSDGNGSGNGDSGGGAVSSAALCRLGESALPNAGRQHASPVYSDNK